jgi:CRISPR-associated protein Cas2
MVAQTTLVITRDVEARYRGFLTSVMLEVAPGVYVSPRMSAGVRDRVWAVVSDWWSTLQRGSLVMIWRDKAAAGHLRIETLGEPAKEIIDADGVLLLKRK